METCLATIIDYEMTPSESVAYKLCCMYYDISRKVFPEYRHVIRSKGDPRKTLLFRYCYKLYNETKNKLKLNEYMFYIQAQMDVLKAITKGKDLPTIQPSILVGEKAWTRWEIWQKYYFKKEKKFKELELDCRTNIEQVKLALNKTKSFLTARNALSEDGIINALNKKDLFLWVGRNQISPYFLLLSPIVKKWIKEKNMTDILESYFDIEFYVKNINQDVKNYFNQTF